MKSSKQLLFLQTASILPLILFLFIYAHRSMAYIILAVALVILLGINIYKYKKDLPLLRYPLFAVLIGSFLIYAFYGLGSRETPQSFETLKRGNIATFHFEKPAQIDKICYYIGIDKNVNFNLNSQEKNRWKRLYTYKENFPFSFRWKCSDQNITVSDIRLFVTKNEMMLGEVYFLHQNKTIPYTTNKPLLHDEQGLTVKQFSRNEVHCFAGVKLPGWKYEIAITEDGEILYDHWGSEANSFDKLGRLIQSYNQRVIADVIPHSEIEMFTSILQKNGNVKMVLEYA